MLNDASLACKAWIEVVDLFILISSTSKALELEKLLHCVFHLIMGEEENFAISVVRKS